MRCRLPVSAWVFTLLLAGAAWTALAPPASAGLAAAAAAPARAGDPALPAESALPADSAFPAGPAYQHNFSPDGHETAACYCRPATAAERGDLALAPDGWVQDGPRESYRRDTVPLPLVPSWVGTRIRATGALVWFDADDDGDQDLFVGTYWANQYPPLEDYYNFIYLNTGGALEANPSWISVDQKHTGDAAWGFINNDIYPDIFLANGGSSLQGSQVFYGQAGLLPTSAGWQNAGGTWTTGCSLADFDLDGDVDVATSNQGISPNPYRPTYLYRNIDGTLDPNPFWQSNQVGITSECDWGDMDGDGYPDLAVSGWSSWQTGVFRNLGTTLDPNFAWTTGVPSRTDKGVGWADVDRDGHPDLAVGGNGGPDWLFHNEGTMLGATPIWASTETYTGCQDLAWVDIDRDGDQDLALIHFSTGHVRIYLNNDGMLSTTADWQYDAASSGSAIGFGDVNGDGWLDLAIGVANGPIELFVSEGLPAGVTPGGAATAADARGPVRVLLSAGPSPARGALSVVLSSAVPVGLSCLELFDLSGRQVARFENGDRASGCTHEVRWEPRRASGFPAAGVYLLRASGRVAAAPGGAGAGAAGAARGGDWAASTRVVWWGE